MTEPKVQGEPVFVIVCTRTARKRPKPCGACGRPSTLLCDYPVGDGKTCDAPICGACSRNVGPDRDYCLTHPERGVSCAP